MNFSFAISKSFNFLGFLSTCLGAGIKLYRESPSDATVNGAAETDATPKLMVHLYASNDEAPPCTVLPGDLNIYLGQLQAAVDANNGG